MGAPAAGGGRVCGFGAFLYLIPPFFITPPETFGKAMADAAPGVNDIADPAERAIARAAATS